MIKKILFLIFNFIILPLLLITIVITLELNKKYIIFPKNRNEFEISTFTDDYYNGNSKVLDFKLDNEDIIFSYILKKGYDYPYAGFSLSTHNPKGIDISKYDTVKVKLNSISHKSIGIILILYLENHTVSSENLSYRYLETELQLENKIRTYSIKRDKFKTHKWWYKKNNLDEKTIKKPNFKHFHAIEFNSSAKTPLNSNESIQIINITLEKDYKFLYLIFAIIIFIYYILITILFKIFNNRTIYQKLKKTLLSIKHIKLNNYSDMESKKLIDYILNNYSNPSLSLSVINKNTGISETKISKIINNNFKISYKQFLNKIRIEEAKNLLKTTDHQIVEIALNVGYNNVSHFNRIFKKMENLSPKEYKNN